MTDDESAKPSAQAEKNEPVILFLVRVIPKDCAIVVKDGFGLLKRNAMFPSIGRILAPIPFES